MYLPAHFHETRLGVMHDLMRTHPLATLVTLASTASRQGAPSMIANHLPLEIHADSSPNGTLCGHMARANPAWREHPSGTDVLVIFQGPQAYVSPSWYPSKQRDGKVVPTWNYAVVHAYGALQVIEDAAWLRGLVGRLTTTHEAVQQTPWKVEDAPSEFIDRMLSMIVGFEIPIARIEGKWKMSQNRPAEDRAGVASGLPATADGVADLVFPDRSNN